MRQVFACPGQYVQRTGMFAAIFLACVFAPIVALSAPYAAYVIDARTGQVLHEENANTRLHPASLTKMMTLYIAFEAIEHGEISLDSKVTISKHAASQPPSKLGLRAGQTIALRYLIRAAAIKSANDAATAIGEAIEGSEPAFARRMTRTAKALGMTKTTFINANGLTRRGHMSTARDMTMLGRHVFYDYPQYYNLFSRRTADAGIKRVASTNRRFLGSYRGADGIKTGYTSAAGFNLVASAQRGEKRIIATVFGGRSTATRNARVAELLDMGFGKAPRHAAVQKPTRPPYLAHEKGVARVVENAPSGSRSLPAGKTIRLHVAVTKSLRPKPRPVPGTTIAPQDDLLLAMQQSIDTVLAEVQDEPVAPAATAVAVQDRMVQVAEPVAAPASPTGPIFVQETAPQPETLAAVAAETTPVIDKQPAPEAANLANASASAPKTSLKPAPSPLHLIAAKTARPVEDTVTAAAPAPGPSARNTQTKPLAVPAPAVAPKTPQVVLTTQAEPEAVVAPAALEVVTRVSTSGGRQWAINVGHYGSRYNAERQLLQTALIEMSTLDEALRKVVAKRGGYDANFVGMTHETAELACRRLRARQDECTVVGP